jgi:hypothetical protein
VGVGLPQVTTGLAVAEHDLEPVGVLGVQVACKTVSPYRVRQHSHNTAVGAASRMVAKVLRRGSCCYANSTVGGQVLLLLLVPSCSCWMGLPAAAQLAWLAVPGS